MSVAIRVKRAYEKPAAADGQRILVERLWPRGVTKAKAKLDRWLKDIAPSPELRKWFAHDPAKWKKFECRYRAELKTRKEPVALLRRKAKEGRVTLIYAAHDEAHNSAVALKRFIEGRKR